MKRSNDHPHPISQPDMSPRKQESLETRVCQGCTICLCDCDLLSFPVFMRLLRSQGGETPAGESEGDSSFPCVLTSVLPCSPAGEVL